LGYHYIRSLIYRPVVCASSTIGDRAGSASVALATSSKHIVQILELLEERTLAYTFCLNKNELLVLSGFGLLFQGLVREGGEALNRNNEKLIHSIADILEQSPSPASKEFRRMSRALTPRSESPAVRKVPILSRHNSDGNLNSSQDNLSSTQKHIRSIMSRFSPKQTRADLNDRRATLPTLTLGQHRTQSQASLSSINSEPTMARSEPTLSPHIQRSSISPVKFSNNRSSTTAPQSIPNLDYLPLGTTASATSAYTYGATTNPTKRNENSSDWERLLSSLDSGQTNIYDTIYGGPAIQGIVDTATSMNNDVHLAWSPDVWALNPDSLSSGQPAPQSVLSFSDESLTSGEEFGDLCSSNHGGETYRGIMIPQEMSPCSVESLGLQGMDGNFGL
jgi:hypothetical protein